jgi:GTP cyclohydrolase I
MNILREAVKMAPYRNLEEYNIEITNEVREHFARILEDLGEDGAREGLQKTPERAAKAMLFLTQGYQQDAVAILKSAMFAENYNEMVIIKDIELYSLCEHHMLPFFGKAHMAYIPDGQIVGLSKIPRVVDVFARRLQVQERLTHDILECLNKTLKPKGVAVVIEAAHMCMMMRGVQKQNSVTTTSGFRGQFEKIETRNEFLKLISSTLS